MTQPVRRRTPLPPAPPPAPAPGPVRRRSAPAMGNPITPPDSGEAVMGSFTAWMTLKAAPNGAVASRHFVGTATPAQAAKKLLDQSWRPADWKINLLTVLDYANPPRKFLIEDIPPGNPLFPDILRSVGHGKGGKP